MKKCLWLIYLLLAFTSCERFDDPIPEGSTLEFPVLNAEVMSPTEVLLTWNSDRICAGFCPPIVLATNYEIWAKSFNASIDYKLATIQSGQKTFLVDGLEEGQVQEFFVIAKRANVSHPTNRVMVVPNELPNESLIFQKEGFNYITHPQVSPDGTEIAYALSKAGAAGSSQNVFLYDLGSKSERLIKENGQYPSWSASGEKLVFVSEEANASLINEYDFKFNLVNERMRNSYKNYFPVYGAEDEFLIFLLDSLQEGKRGLVSFDPPNSNPSFLKEVEVGEFPITSVLGIDFSPTPNNVVYSVSFPKDTNRGFSYDIVGFDLGSPATLTNWVVSDWNDTNPAISTVKPDLLAFISDRSGVPQVWIKNTVNQKMFQVTDFQGSEWINIGIAGISWSGMKIFINKMDVQGTTRLVSIDVSSLIQN